MQIRRLYYGCIDGPLGQGTPFNGYLIDHPKGLTLIDTGFGSSLARIAGPDADIHARAGAFEIHGQRFPWIRRTSTEALRDHGIEPIDVKYIINTHVGDHSGDNHLFPHATFIIQQPEMEYARARDRNTPVALAEWDFPGARLELLQGEDVEIMPGLTCLFTPGHTPGHQSILYEQGDERILFCGDAIYTSTIWDDLELVQPNTVLYHLQIQMAERGLEVWKESARKLKALQLDEIHFAHDANVVSCNHQGHCEHKL